MPLLITLEESGVRGSCLCQRRVICENNLIALSGGVKQKIAASK